MMPIEFYFFCNNLLDALRKFSHNGVYEITNANINDNEYWLQTII
ncbi:MAG: hypothetical protein ACJAYN_002531 [Bermanella sp.]|jgi:hypothetical protein